MADPADRLWDVIVIGAGLGGGMAARALAEAGKSVLIVEKGPFGPRREETAIDTDVFDPEARLVRGLWPAPMQGQINGREAGFFGPIGAGVGGSSAFYAATLERPERHDLESTDAYPHPTGGWPLGLADFAPWYARAEELLHVCGAPDPLSPEPCDLPAPPPPGPGDAALMDVFRARGLHPYRLHSAIRYLDGCAECLGRKCPRACKMDGRSAGVEPALATGNAQVLPRADAVALRGAGRRVSHLEIRHDGEMKNLRARTYLLAAGAFGSPRLLLRSTDWPQGAANSSGMAGRNLMFHLNEMIALWPPRGTPQDGPGKAISLRDLYHLDGQRFGTVQSMGIDAGYGEILHFLRGMLARSRLANSRLAAEAARLPAAIAARLFGQAKVFVGLLEDLPDPENRVTLPADGGDTLCFQYQMSPELLARRRAFRRHMRRAFRGTRRMFLNIGPELNYGHPCGTLRFGDDPATSVLNADCRAHDLDNLHVADASFMPTSMGVNPGLTIAANALRVADVILAERKGA